MRSYSRLPLRPINYVKNNFFFSPAVLKCGIFLPLSLVKARLGDETGSYLPATKSLTPKEFLPDQKRIFN